MGEAISCVHLETTLEYFRVIKVSLANMIREISDHFHCVSAVILEGRFIYVHSRMKFQGRRNP